LEGGGIFSEGSEFQTARHMFGECRTDSGKSKTATRWRRYFQTTRSPRMATWTASSDLPTDVSVVGGFTSSPVSRFVCVSRVALSPRTLLLPSLRSFRSPFKTGL
jgi:hypothetical protein